MVGHVVAEPRWADVVGGGGGGGTGGSVAVPQGRVGGRGEEREGLL